MSSGRAGHVRKPAQERRAEILADASAIALEDGLERVTLRAVAERLGVRPGLITHYFPVADDLVVEAFVLAVSGERERLFPTTGAPLQRIATLVARVQSEDARGLARLWLNARHLSRFRPVLAESLEGQEALDRERLAAIIAAGRDAGVFRIDDPLAACVRILVAVDGFGAYVNNTGRFDVDAYTNFVADTAEWALGLPAGALRIAASEIA